MDPTTILVASFLLGLLPALIASGKGHNFLLWWLYGGLLWIIALPHSILIGPNVDGYVASGRARKCPFCAEAVRWEAVVCKHCGRDLPEAVRPDEQPLQRSYPRSGPNALCSECKGEIASNAVQCPHCGVFFGGRKEVV